MLTRRSLTVLGGVAALTAATALGTATAATPTGGTVNGFAFGEMQSATVGSSGCGTNIAGEPSLHVSRANLVGLGSEDGVGSGSEYWRAGQVGGSTSASACGLEVLRSAQRRQPGGRGSVATSTPPSRR